MIIKILGTASSSPLDKLIMLATGEPVAHMAFLMTPDANEKEKGIVFQANLLGCKILWQKDFWASHTPVYELRTPPLTDEQKKSYFEFVNKQDGKSYDFEKLFADGFYYLRKKLFGLTVPETTSIYEAQSMLCSDLATQLPNWIITNPPTVNTTMTPFKMLNFIASQHPEWELIKT